MKQVYLKKWLESALIGIFAINILSAFVLVDTITKTNTIDYILIGITIINIIILKVLLKYGKNFK